MEPSATRVSIFGARCQRLLKPLIKNFRLTIMMTVDNSSSMTPIPAIFPSRNFGAGQFHMQTPMLKYMSAKRNPRDHQKRRRSFGVSVSRRASSSSFSRCDADVVFSSSPPRFFAP